MQDDKHKKENIATIMPPREPKLSTQESMAADSTTGDDYNGAGGGGTDAPPKNDSFHGVAYNESNAAEAGVAKPVLLGGTPSSSSQKQQPIHLRWSRIQKVVTVRESNSGLLRGSIAAPTPQSKQALAKMGGGGGSTQKVILSHVSGAAGPGQVLCMMG